jgi:hypothetical protein
MSNGRLAQPEPSPEGLLAHARKIARLTRRATDSVNSTFLIQKAEEQYGLAIEALNREFRIREAFEARAELERFRAESVWTLHQAPLLLEGSAFRTALDDLAASKDVGRFFNGTDDVDEIVSIARRRMGNRDRLAAAEDATRAATCMLWRAEREEETVALYDEFTDVLVKDIMTSIDAGNVFLVEARSRIARTRLLLTGRREDAEQLATAVSLALEPRTVSSST